MPRKWGLTTEHAPGKFRMEALHQYLALASEPFKSVAIIMLGRGHGAR
jgi:hypothetical protein